jgi:hypothetical protein
MTKIKFDYEKDNGDKSTRDVILLNERNTYIDTIDTTKLSEKEINEMVTIIKDYESKMKPYMKIAFRRFSSNNMKNLIVEKVND